MYIIDGRNMLTKQDAYDEIRRALDIHDYMGNNLDALNDILSTMRGDIALIHACAMLNSLKKYGLRLLEVFFDASQDSDYMTFRLGMHNEQDNA